MRIERIVSHSTHIPRTVSAPWSLGFFRHPAAPPLIEEIQSLEDRHGRVLFAGLTDPQNQLPHIVSELRRNSPQIDVGVLLHWTEALSAPNATWHKISAHTRDVFVAVDHLLSKEQADSIRTQWNPKWIVVPRVGLDWDELITRRIFADKRGDIFLWAPPADNPDGPFLSVDELMHHMRNMRIAHPLINIIPVPEAWHITSENGPKGSLIRPVFQTIPESDRTLSLSVIVPVRTFENGCAKALEALQQALVSWRDSFEIIICLDGIAWPNDLPLDPHTRILDLKRTNDSDDDWRPGYVRNCGAAASKCRHDGLLLFCDADTQISADLLTPLRETANAAAWQFAQLAENPAQLKWQSTTSKVFAVRRFAFERSGGFPEAFSHYGCEDNALVWRLLQARYIGRALAPNAVVHLRAQTDDDDGLLKMHRLRRSASLFYRMMVSTEADTIYWHFFSALDENDSLATTALRALLRNAYRLLPVRMLVSVAVFFLTLQQTDSRAAYIRGIIEAGTWKIRTRSSKLAGSNISPSKLFHSLKSNFWKVPWTLARPFRIIKANLWRATTIHQTLVSSCSRWALQTYHFIKGNFWKIPWTLARPFHIIKANLWRASTVHQTLVISCRRWVLQTYHFIKGNLWRIPWTLARPFHIIKANLWFFKAPHSWLRENWPWFYRSVVVKLERRKAGPS